MSGIDPATRSLDYVPQPASQPAPADAADDSGFGFDDLLDIVNPLQHIPVISTLYKHLTGDTIGTPEKIAGDALYGGVIGFFCSIGDALFAQVTGKGVGDTVYAALFGDDQEPATAVAAKATPAPASPVGNSVAMSQAAAAYRASGRLLEAY